MSAVMLLLTEEIHHMNEETARELNKQLKAADTGWSSRLDIAWEWDVEASPCRQAASYKVLMALNLKLAFVNTVMNIWVPRKTGNFSAALLLLIFQEGLWSMEWNH
jgi:hypothetical protein